MKNFCKHGYHQSILCLSCQAELKVRNEKLSEGKRIVDSKKSDRQKALERIKRRARRLDW